MTKTNSRILQVGDEVELSAKGNNILSYSHAYSNGPIGTVMEIKEDGWGSVYVRVEKYNGPPWSKTTTFFRHHVKKSPPSTTIDDWL